MSIASDMSAADNVADKILANTERQIKNAYKQAYTDMKSVFSDVFAKYESGGVLTYAEMQKYNRLKAMEIELQKTLKELYSTDSKIMNNGLTETYKSSYYRTAYAIEKEVQARLSYMPLDTARIKAAIQNPISGLTLTQILEKNRDAIISKINQEITRGLIQGQSYGKMASAIKETLGGDAKKAITVAQTEAHRVHNQARLESSEHAEDTGVEMVKVWVSTLDILTRDAHQTLDGMEADKNGNFHSSNGGKGPAPGMMGTAADDINCRCEFRDEIKGFKPEFRRIRGEGVVPYKTYQEWADGHGISSELKTEGKIAISAKTKATVATKAQPSTTLTEGLMEKKLGAEGIYLDWLDDTMKNQYLNGMNRMTNEFPELKGVIGKIKTVKDKTDCVAEFTQAVGKNELLISAQYSSNAETFNSLFTKQIKSGFYPKTWSSGNAAEYTIQHEMAHSLEAKLTLKSLNLTSMPDNIWEWQTYSKSWGTSAKTIVNQAVKNTGIKKEVLGRYALVNDSEAFAQGITDAINSSAPSKLSLEIMRLTKGMLK